MLFYWSKSVFFFLLYFQLWCAILISLCIRIQNVLTCCCLQVLEKIKDVIIATDLLEYFKNRNVLGPIVESGTYSWKNAEHRFISSSPFFLLTFLQFPNMYQPQNLISLWWRFFLHWLSWWAWYNWKLRLIIFLSVPVIRLFLSVC